MSRTSILTLSILLLAGACSETPPRYQIDSAQTPAPEVDLIVLKDTQAGVEASIAPSKGGEMSSLRVLFHDQWVETLYLANDYSPREGWTGKAPLLWPSTGRNFPPDLEERRRAGEQFDNGAYEYNGKRFDMPIHGFVRDMPWEVVSKTADDQSARVTLALEDTPQTREWYPFGFRLEVEYVLADGKVGINYVIRSRPENQEPMFFSIGNHITFNTPLVKGSDPAAMIFKTPSTQELLKTPYGVPTGETRARSHADGLALGDFERLGAVSLTGYPDPKAPFVELSDPAGLTIRMSHEPQSVPEQPIILFNVWGDPPAGYFSPEPWVGLQNSFVLGKGLIYLDPGKTYNWKVSIQFQQ